MRRTVALFGVVVGVALGLLAYAAIQTITVSVTAGVSNPACGIPGVGVLCSFGLVPAAASSAADFTVQGLGQIVIMAVLLFLILVAIVGFAILLVMRQRASAGLWALFIALLFLSFLATFALTYGVLLWYQYPSMIATWQAGCGCVLKYPRTLAWDAVLPWIAGGILAALATLAAFRYVWRQPSRAGGMADGA
jgi:hypothetical protein